MTNQFKKQNKVSKHLNIFYEKIILGLKATKEYKTNFWMMNTFDVFLFLARMTFFSSFGILIYDIVGWQTSDFFLYLCFDLLSWKMLWLINLRDFAKRLLSGELNTYLIRPANSFFLSSIRFINGNNIISSFYLFAIAIGVLMYYKYTFTPLAFIFMIFSWIYFMTYQTFFASFAFFMKKSELLLKPIEVLESTVSKYTPKLFESSPASTIIYLLPAAVQGFLMVEIIKGNIALLKSVIPILASSFIILILGTYILWKIGLKKYEAFG